MAMLGKEPRPGRDWRALGKERRPLKGGRPINPYAGRLPMHGDKAAPAGKDKGGRRGRPAKGGRR